MLPQRLALENHSSCGSPAPHRLGDRALEPEAFAARAWPAAVAEDACGAATCGVRGAEGQQGAAHIRRVVRFEPQRGILTCAWP